MAGNQIRQWRGRERLCLTNISRFPTNLWCSSIPFRTCASDVHQSVLCGLERHPTLTLSRIPRPFRTVHTARRASKWTRCSPVLPVAAASVHCQCLLTTLVKTACFWISMFLVLLCRRLNLKFPSWSDSTVGLMYMAPKMGLDLTFLSTTAPGYYKLQRLPKRN